VIVASQAALSSASQLRIEEPAITARTMAKTFAPMSNRKLAKPKNDSRKAMAYALDSVVKVG
jgi:hypothetical protein